MADKDQTYDITDFLNNTADAWALELEIIADVGITTALQTTKITVFENDPSPSVDIHFVSDIDAGEKTALDALVALHDGVPVDTDPMLNLEVSGQIGSLDVKSPPVVGDLMLLQDSEDSGALKAIDCDEFSAASHGHTDALHDNVSGEIVAITLKGTPTTSDHLVIEDAAASDAKKRVTIGSLPAAAPASHTHLEADITDLDHTDAAAIHDNASGEISSVTAKATPTTSDHLLIEDAAASDAKKRITIGDLPAAAPASHTHLEADITDLDHTDTSAIHDNASGELVAITLKGTPTTSDILLIEDAAAGNAKKRTTIGDLPAAAPASHTHLEADITDLDHTDADAIHENVNGEISTVTEKATPIAADLVLIEDSAASNAKKRVQVGNLPVPDHSTHATVDVTGKAGFDKQEQLAKSGSVTFDLTAGNRHYMEITGNITVTVTNPFTSGQDKMSSGTMVIKQKGSGSYTATWSLGSDQTFGRTAGTPVAKPALYTAVDSKTLVHWNWDGDELHLRRDSEA